MDSKYKEGQKVKLKIIAETDLGFKAIIEDDGSGVVYYDEVFTHLRVGDRTTGFIKKIRPDGLIDLALYETGLKGAGDIADRIMDLLKDSGGKLDINDKTPAEEIYRLFGVSKKKYKIALGGLYKQRLIVVTDEGITLV